MSFDSPSENPSKNLPRTFRTGSDDGASDGGPVDPTAGGEAGSRPPADQRGPPREQVCAGQHRPRKVAPLRPSSH
eukprot:550387-Pyramimonas_sp.AAC.1